VSYEKFLDAYGNTLLGHYLMAEWCGKRFSPATPAPPSNLSAEALQDVKRRLNECMPLESMILDLWDWDVHFEDVLASDWYFEAVFGDASSLEACADRIGDFFLAQSKRHAMDYDPQADPEAFEALVREEARDFVAEWRDNAIARFG
jgi:hypothetical protein